VCYRYQAKRNSAKGFGWNHKRVYRIYRELELNLCIKPRKRLVREKPETLAVQDRINAAWSIDFMHGRTGEITDGIQDYAEMDRLEATLSKVSLGSPPEKSVNR